MLWTIVVILLIVALLGGIGPWAPGGYGYGYGHGGVGLIGVLLIILVLWLLMGGRL